MNLTRFRVLFLIVQLIVTSSCLRGIIIEPSKSEESWNLVEAAVKVVKCCYGTRVNTVGLVDKSLDGSLVASLSSAEPLSIIVLDNTTRSVNNEHVSHISRSKLQIFVVLISISTDLQEILVDIKNSRWWNHMAHFYILESPGHKDGCSGAFENLRKAWKMNLLDAKFMCTHRTKGRLIYSFNPYTKDAPDPWQFEKTYSSGNDHPWTLLAREYQDGEICDGMDYDKSRKLGGYEIRVTVKNLTWEVFVDATKTGVDSLGGTIGDVAQTIFRRLNATAKLLIHGGDEPIGFVDNENKVHGVMAETANGISDFALQSVGTHTVANLTSIYPYYQSGLGVITQYESHKSQLSKIISIIDKTSRIGLCLVCLITLFFLKLFVRQTLATAILNTVRMICNAALTKLPDNLSPRIYFVSLFVFVITMHGIYQGKLASLLAQQIRNPHVDTRLDLVESNHKIYGHDRWSAYFPEKVFDGRYVGITGYNCTKYVLRDPMAACLIVWAEGVVEAARFKLHLSKKLIHGGYITWIIREDWPLERKFNDIVQRIVESNLYKYSVERSLEASFGIMDYNDNEDRHLSRKILTLGDLSFAFAILGIGLGCAMISFIIEKEIHVFKTNANNESILSTVRRGR